MLVNGRRYFGLGLGARGRGATRTSCPPSSEHGETNALGELQASCVKLRPLGLVLVGLIRIIGELPVDVAKRRVRLVEGCQDGVEGARGDVVSGVHGG